MTFGKACNSLKKLWKSYKIAGRTGEFRGDTAWKIRNIEFVLGINESEFPELEGMDDEEMEIGSEESEGDDWSEEDKQLRREERGDEQENDDW